jgi:hypothetical protein
LPTGSLVLLGVALLVGGCGSGNVTQGPSATDPSGEQAIAVPAVRFSDVTAKAGIDFVHTNGSSGKKLLPETMGGGVAFLDFNRDGKPDLLFINSCYWPGHEGKGPAPTPRLYRNDSQGGVIRFTDVTKEYGLDVTMYGMGVTVGDYDNDGWPDVFVTGVGGNRLFRNVGGKRFEDVTAKAGVGGPGGWPAAANDFLKWNKPINWSTSAAWLDYDGDGRLDLFVCNYVTWSPDYDLKLEATLAGTAEPAYAPPYAFPGTQCFLYRNKGDGTFEDVSARAGIPVLEAEGAGAAARRVAVGKSLGVIACDVDEDGWPDIIVANDTRRNFFFHNKGDGTFEEVGQACGVGLAANGRARGAMGIDEGEYAPGRRGVLIGNFADEPDSLLALDSRARPGGKNLPLFSDVAVAEGLAVPSQPLLKFGAFFFDYDLDGRLDVLTCNGHLEPGIARVRAGQSYLQPPQLFWNTGREPRRFELVTEGAAGGDPLRPMAGRACAYADIDGDGTPDVVLVANGGPARLLRNEGGTGNHWVRLTLEGDGVRSNRSAIGARVTLEAGGMVQHREVASARGYLSQSELTLTFGLGPATAADRVTVRWPGKGGGETVVTDLKADRVHEIRQGE